MALFRAWIVWWREAVRWSRRRSRRPSFRHLPRACFRFGEALSRERRGASSFRAPLGSRGVDSIEDSLSRGAVAIRFGESVDAFRFAASVDRESLS